MLQGKVHMAQFSVEIRHPVGSVLAEKQQLKELELENTRLRKAVSDLTLDKLILKEAARGTY
jgi:cell division protein FtsB